MKEDELGKILGSLTNMLMGIGALAVFLIGLLLYLNENPEVLQNFDEPAEAAVTFSPELVEQMGFTDDQHVDLVIVNCTGCHSSKLVTQNRATKEGWRSMIEWMQRTQNLKDLGIDEEKILEYLAKNYAPTDQSRRANLKDIEWYKLD